MFNGLKKNNTMALFDLRLQFKSKRKQMVYKMCIQSRAKKPDRKWLNNE